MFNIVFTGRKTHTEIEPTVYLPMKICELPGFSVVLLAVLSLEDKICNKAPARRKYFDSRESRFLVSSLPFPHLPALQSS